jgi:hypothetical protein
MRFSRQPREITFDLPHKDRHFRRQQGAVLVLLSCQFRSVRWFLVLVMSARPYVPYIISLDSSKFFFSRLGVHGQCYQLLSHHGIALPYISA